MPSDNVKWQFMNETERKLTLKQEKALACLLSEPTIEAAAKAAKVSKTILYEWLKQPEFKAALDNAKHLLFSDGLATLKASVQAGVETLRACLTDPDATVANKIAAATKLIELGLRSHEQLEIETRLSALEALQK